MRIFELGNSVSIDSNNILYIAISNKELSLCPQKNAQIVISKECISYSDLEIQVAQLKANLDEVLNLAATK